MVELIESGFETHCRQPVNSRLEVLDGIEAIARARPAFEKLDL
jgi:hypothetical protein